MSDSGLRSDLAWGVRGGLRTGVIFAVLNVVVFVMPPERRPQYNVPVVALSLIPAGMLAGMIVGVARRRVTSTAWAGGVGMLAAVPVAILISVLALPREAAFFLRAIFGATLVVIGGGFAGITAFQTLSRQGGDDRRE